MSKTKKLLSLTHDQLLTHPRNMRRFYNVKHVKEMANSILAANGVLEPLIVVTDLHSEKYIVIDGNMRLAGARTLGNKCPKLDCKLIKQDESEQLLSMMITNNVRYDVDPVSEALHYKALKSEGLSIRGISKRTGVYEARIIKRIILADLDEPIQELIVSRKLPADKKVARALLRLTSDVRVKFAKRISENPNIKIETIIKACERLSEDKKTIKKLKNPAVELSGALDSKGKTDVKSIRASVRKVCQKCNQVEANLLEEGEPAWAMVVHAVDKNCQTCELKEMQRICALCPAVAFLRNLISMKDKSNGK